MNAPSVIIRPATTADAPAVLAIYRPYIEETAITFEEDVPFLNDIAGRIEKCLGHYPWLLCTVDGEVAGYAYAGIYNERAAYQWTCLCSIYLAPGFQGKGIARPFYEALFSLLRAQGYQTVFALITLPNEPSVRLHERCGFSPFTVFDHIGYKLGQWQKVGWWRLSLGNYPDNPPPPIPFSRFDSDALIAVLSSAEEAVRKRITSFIS
jgi:L-amino acid N-acyltransferase YncA